MANASKVKLSGSRLRFLILLLSCAVLVAINYCNDVPSIIKNDFLEYFHSYENVDAEYVFNMLYTTYSVPNIVIPFFGGVVCDKIGARMMTVVLCFLILIGQMLFSLSLFVQDIRIMIAARFVYGLGGETIKNTVTSLIMRWFAGREVALSQGIKTSSSRLTYILNALVTSALVVKGSDVSRAINLGTALMAGAFLIAILLCILDRRAESSWRKKHHLPEETEQRSTVSEICKNTTKLNRMYWNLVALSTLVYMSWQVVTTCSSSYMAERMKREVTEPQRIRERVGFILALQSGINMIATPLLGWFIDKHGRRVLLLGLALILLLLCMFSLMLFHPLVPMVLFGICTSVFSAALWPTVFLLVDERYFSTAYGVLTSANNVGLSVAPMIISRFRTREGDYGQVFLVFTVFVIIAFLIFLDFRRADSRHKNSLDGGNQKKIKKELEDEATTEGNHQEEIKHAHVELSIRKSPTVEESYEFVEAPNGISPVTISKEN